MNLKDTIEFLKEDHQKMEFIIETLNPEELVQHRITQLWNIKDIIGHLAAWNIALTESVDQILNNNEMWFVNQKKQTISEFNQIQVALRKSYTIEEIIEEWQDSFNKLLERLKIISDEDWTFEASFNWNDGTPVTVRDLFEYRYRGYGHEGGHADQIEDYFESDRCSCRPY